MRKTCKCGIVHDLTKLVDAKPCKGMGLTLFQCQCGSTLSIKTEILDKLIVAKGVSRVR